MKAEHDAPGLNRRLAVAGFGALAAGIASSQTATPANAAQSTPVPEVPPDFRVVLHAADADRWPFVLSNARNLAADWLKARVRIVVDGNGVTTLSGANSVVAELEKLAATGLELFVCPNALQEHQIAVDQVPGFADTWYGGVVALVIAAREGFVYIRP